MLIEFKFKNFRSFQSETVISMVGSSDKTLPENTCTVESFGNRRLLKSAVIYGANAAGKSNIIAATNFVSDLIAQSAERNIDTPIDIKPFMLTTKPNYEPSEFEITFLDEGNIRFQYGFRLNRDRILGEWLIAYPFGLPQTWFERVFLDEAPHTQWTFGRKLKGQNNQIAELTRPDVLFLSNAAKLNHKQLSPIYKWFRNNFRVIFASEFDPRLYLYSAIKAKENESLKLEVSRLLEVADFGISGFDVKEENYSEKDFPEDMPSELRNQFIDKKRLDVVMHHTIDGIKLVSFDLDEESNGTKRFFTLSGPLIEVLENGWTLFVDELDSSLHPLLVNYLVKLFHNPISNPKGAQIIFNTHDTTLLDNRLFRRDQIWFVEKDRNGCSHLYSLIEYSPRKNESLAKGYLQGRYGAIPFLGELVWGKTSND